MRTTVIYTQVLNRDDIRVRTQADNLTRQPEKRYSET